MPATTLPDEFRRAVDHAFQLSPARFQTGIGPLVTELAFADPQTATSFRSAFPSGAAITNKPHLSIAVLHVPDTDLEPLIPAIRDETFSLVDDGCYAVWNPAPAEGLHVYDRFSQRGFCWLPTGQALDSFRSRPVLPPIHAHLADNAWAPVHAGAVGRHGKMLLLAGPGGSGKSTAAIACAAAGWDYAGDDFVLVEPQRGAIEPIYTSARVRPATAEAFPEFVAKTQVGVTHDFGDPRHELRLPLAGVRIVGGQIAAILLPRRSGAKAPAIRRAGPAETFYAVVEATRLQLPGFRDNLASKLAALVRSAPSFVVDTGTDPRAIPAMLSRLLSEL